MLPASAKVNFNLLLQSLVQVQTEPPLVHVLVFLSRPNEDQNDKNPSLPRYLIISTCTWSLNLDRPPGLRVNLLLVNHTHVYQIILYNEATDWGIFTVIISFFLGFFCKFVWEIARSLLRKRGTPICCEKHYRMDMWFTGATALWLNLTNSLTTTSS